MPNLYTFNLKMANAMFTEMSNNFQHMMQEIPESQRCRHFNLSLSTELLIFLKFCCVVINLFKMKSTRQSSEHLFGT